MIFICQIVLLKRAKRCHKSNHTCAEVRKTYQSTHENGIKYIENKQLGIVFQIKKNLKKKYLWMSSSFEVIYAIIFEAMLR